MFKRIFTFWTVFLFLLSFFVLFFFDTLKAWGVLAELFRIAVISSFIVRSFFIIQLILNDRKEKEDDEQAKLGDLIIERKIETLKRRGLR